MVLMVLPMRGICSCHYNKCFEKIRPDRGGGHRGRQTPRRQVTYAVHPSLRLSTSVTGMVLKSGRRGDGCGAGEMRPDGIYGFARGSLVYGGNRLC